MTSTIEILNHRITLAIGVIALVGLGLGFMDSRHASAADMQQLTEMILDDRIEELEYKIEDIEAQISHIMSAPKEDWPDWAPQQLLDLENKRERYLRKLERLIVE